MLVQDKKVAIVGGGPAGLMLARLLQLKKVDVSVFERDADKDARMIGSPLDMHEGSGLTAIREAGLFEEFRKLFRPGADRKLIMDGEAKVFYSDHDTKPEEDFGNEFFRPEIDRYPLRNMLLDSLQPGTVRWNSRFISMEEQGEGWLLHFKNQLPVYADIVVAADGANSKIRPYITDIKAFYSGIIMLEGSVPDAAINAPRISELLNGGKIMAFGNEKNILLGSKGNGDINFYASFRSGIDWAANGQINLEDKKEVLEWFKLNYVGWSDIWNELFENSITPFIPRIIYCMPLDQSWEPGSNVTMIGDAAHVMPPFAGEGANMAFLDALQLSRYFTSDEFPTLQEAIGAFEKGMLERSSLAAEESLQNGETMHSKDALRSMLEFFDEH